MDPPGLRRGSRRWQVLVLALLALTGGCSFFPSEPYSGIGVSRDAKNRLSVHYLACPGDAVKSVRLTADDGRVLWQGDRGPDGVKVNSVTIGDLPAGWTSQPDGDSLPDTLLVDIQTDQREEVGQLRVETSRLGAGQVSSDRGVVSAQSYEELQPDCSE